MNHDFMEMGFPLGKIFILAMHMVTVTSIFSQKAYMEPDRRQIKD